MQENVSIQPYAVRNGLILGAISTIYSLSLYITNLSTDPAMGWVSLVVSLGLIIFFMVQTFNAFKGVNEGYMSLGQGFKGGFIMTLISSVISTIVTYLYLTFVDSSALQRAIEIQRETMLQNPNMTEEQVDQAMSMVEKFTTPEITAGISIVGAVFLGAVVSLIMAAIMKKDHETY